MKKKLLKLFLPMLALLVLMSINPSKALAEFPDINFSVSAPTNVQPGEGYTITVNYTNNTGGAIENVVISTDYPIGLGFSYASVDPDTGTDNTWTVGDLADLATGSETIYVIVDDSVAPLTRFENLFTFAYEVGGEAQRPIIEGDLTTVREPALQVWNFNPLGAGPGDQTMYRIAYRNYSDVTAENVVFTYTYPTDFAYNVSVPVPTSGDNIWDEGDVSADTYDYIYVTLDVDPLIAVGTMCESSLKVDYDCSIDKANEPQTSTDATTVTVSHTPVNSVAGVYLADDPEHAGTNYYSGGGFDANTGEITVDALPSATEAVLVDYEYTKSYTQTLTDNTKIIEDYFQMLVDEASSSMDIGQQPWSPDSEWIVFKSDFSGNNDIYKIKKDGTELTQLTTYPECDNMPVWSPVADKIAYSRYNGGTMPDPYDPDDDDNADIYVMDADGSNKTQLTTKGDCQHWAVWSPDGTKISYKDDMGTEDMWYPSLWVMNSDGSGKIPLLVSGYAGTGGKPWQFWSPDSQWLAFPSTIDDSDDYTDVYKIKVDGTGLTRLTWTYEMCEQVGGFSADGNTILYWTEDNGTLYTMDKDGLGRRLILDAEEMIGEIHGQKSNFTPPYGPNNKSRWILSQIYMDGSNNYQIWIVSWDGKYLKQLTSVQTYMYNPVMNYDCSAIVCHEPNEQDLYVINLGCTDTDGDGLKDWEEQIIGSDPDVADTDGDGVNDGQEYDTGMDPLDASDAPAPAAADDDKCFISTAAF